MGGMTLPLSEPRSKRNDADISLAAEFTHSNCAASVPFRACERRAALRPAARQPRDVAPGWMRAGGPSHGSGQ